MKNSLISIGILIGVVVLLMLLVLTPNSSSELGSITRDTLRGQSNTYTQHIASTTASRALTSDTGRIDFDSFNTGDNNVRMFLQSTSTGVSATSGIPLASTTGSYSPNFTWVGEVWVITPSGTSSVILQSTR